MSEDTRTQDTPTPVNDNASYYGIMSAKCGTQRMLFSFEVQAERMDEAMPPPGYYLNVHTTSNQQIVHP